MAAQPPGDLLTNPALDRAHGVDAMSDLTARADLTDRVRRVLPALLTAHRWPDPQAVPHLVPTYVGAVLADHPLPERDNSAKIRICGGVAAYCWDYLPDTAWRLLERPAVDEGEDGADHARPLFWAGAHGIVADRVYVGIHRRLDAVVDTSWNWAQEWSQALGAPITAVRVLPLAQRPGAQVVTAAGTRPLAGTAFAVMGGVWR